MTPVDELLLKYDGYSDQTLYEIHANIAGYSKDAKDALDIVIAKRGGLAEMQNRLAEKKVINDEVSRIAKESDQLVRKHIDVDVIKTRIGSDILPGTEVDEIIKLVYDRFQVESKDKAINSRTIVGSFVGTLIASIVGGIVWGLQLITMARMFMLLIIGIALINYGIIRFVTKQTRQNIVVLIAVVVSVILSVFIGQILYEIFGYQGAQFNI